MATKKSDLKRKSSFEEVLFHKIQLNTPADFLKYFRMSYWITTLQLLNNQFKKIVSKKCSIANRLDLAQFWSIVGDDFILEITTLIKRFPIVTDISFAYCNNVGDETLKKFMEALKQDPKTIKKLDLFYNNRLTDKAILWICERFPNIEDLNIGRCMSVTDRALDKVASLKNLKKLSISSTELGLDSLMFLEENKCLERLKELNIKGCKKITKKRFDVCVRGHQRLTVISDFNDGHRGRGRSLNGGRSF